jgi:MSHA biogenesis protein MshJ
MKALWSAQARRIDALSLRERAIMFISLVLALGALVDALLLSPAMAERRTLAAQLRQQNQELDALRGQLAAATQAAPDSPLGRQRAAVTQARNELAALDGQVHSRLSSQEELTRLPELLDRVLRRHERLTLTRLATVGDAASAGVTATPTTPATPLETSAVRWQGVDLSVAGSYLDLMQYLTDLEHALPGLRWGALQIGTQTSPPVLTVRLLLAGEAR